MPKLFAATIVLFLLLGAGYGAIQAARSIPWDCSDWQAFAHADRTTAILETLAENRGKTLYCGIDQSDTFSKAETWAAGRDRNERDDTVYWGERGSFRGFIAAQEGWLTDGESGITGQSIASIFEFPKEERQRRRKKYQYLRGAADDSRQGESYSTWSAPGPEGSSTLSAGDAQDDARTAFDAANPNDAERNRRARSEDIFFEWIQSRSPQEIQYSGGANGYCRHLGYDRAVNVRTTVDTGISAQVRYTGERQEGGTWYARAIRIIRYTNVDCVRRK